MQEINDIFHTGELLAQEKFNASSSLASRTPANLRHMFKTSIDDQTAFFIEGQHYFFIASASDIGECDCSFRGTEADAAGKLLPAAQVVNPSTIIFPDYSGNNIYSSLGNMLLNPHIGLLFIDFNSALRLRVNGSTTIIEDPSAYLYLWPKALRLIQVTIKQVYWNCPKRIKESVPRKP